MTSSNVIYYDSPGPSKEKDSMKRTIECIDNVFNPDANSNPVPFVIQVGDTVVWHNQGNDTHNCVSTGNPRLPSEVPDFDVGQTSIEIGPFTTRTDQQGIQYTCSHHPGMDGIIIVS
jgi:plastocyanin